MTESVNDLEAAAPVHRVFDVSVCGRASGQVIHRGDLERDVAVSPVGPQRDEIAAVVVDAVGEEFRGDDEDIGIRVVFANADLPKPSSERGTGGGKLCGFGRDPALKGRHARSRGPYPISRTSKTRRLQEFLEAHLPGLHRLRGVVLVLLVASAR